MLHSLCLCVCVCLLVFRLELLLQRANKIQNMALDCEEKLTLAKNTLQAVSAEPLLSFVCVLTHTCTHTVTMLGYYWTICCGTRVC